MNLRTAFLLVASIGIASSSFASAKITIKNTDQAGVGFNDATPAAPVGGNNGTTVGEQRMNVFLEAARIWGEQLDSTVEIVVDASFAPLNCTATSGTLGSAGPVEIFADFPNAPKAGVWYPVALANKLARTNLTPGQAHIRARFNGKLGDAGCLEGRSWYYGLDGNHSRKIDLVVVLLHEFAHGLGVIGGVNVSGSGGQKAGEFYEENKPFIYDLHALDTANGLRMDQMSNDQRAVSLSNDQKVVWDGDSVKTAAAGLLDTFPLLTASAAGASKTYNISSASFGKKLTRAGLNGAIVAASDAAEPAAGSVKAGTPLDGCSPYTNAADVRGNIAIVNEGRCSDVDKGRVAQAAGATALIIATIDPKLPDYLPLGFDDTLTISVFGTTKANGDALRVGGLSGAIFADLTRMAGADQNGMIRLYMPSTVEPGSTYSHFDRSANPNLLMEPSISSDLTHGVDVTLNLLLDLGWGIDTTPPPPPATGRRFLKRG